MKFTDYVAKFLVEQGVHHVFGLTGGAVVHFFDSLEKTPGIKPIFTHHEQAASLAAEAYSRITNNLGAAIVTTGPGGTNAITGLCAAWLDSIPCIFISGQTRIEHTTQDKAIRQLGSQQLNIIAIVKSITKFAVMVEDPKKIRYYLEKAAYIAKNGRPGPVWVDIPLNFQWLDIDPSSLKGFDQSEIEGMVSDKEDKRTVDSVMGLIAKSRRPVIIAGNGIHLSHAEKEFVELINRSHIPFVSTWNASDYIPTDDPDYLGRLGINGQRGANFAVQNADLIISIGSHLSIPLTGTNYDAFARDAKIVMVDIDKVEIDFKKDRVDLAVQCDARQFISGMLRRLNSANMNVKREWLNKCVKYKKHNYVPKEWFKQKKPVNPYVFLDILSEELLNNDVICVDGGGTVLYMAFQGMRIKAGQRLIVSAGIGAMGAGLPESVGACFAHGKKRTICLSGDGSIQFNIHELETIKYHKLPIKIFVINNNGYLAIRHTQNGFLSSKYIGSSEKGGVSLPDFQKVAKAYGLKAVRIDGHQRMREKIKKVLKDKGPVFCEIMVSGDQELIPRMTFKQNPDGTNLPMPLEDLYPFLDRNEFRENMIVEPLPESK